MAFRPGTGATFTKAMATAGINIRTIAQGSSERQISICVEAADCAKALRAAHAALALSSTQVTLTITLTPAPNPNPDPDPNAYPNLSSTQISVAVLGATGAVGSEFLEQLVESKKLLTDPSVAGKRKAVSENQHRLQGEPNP